MKIFDYYYIYYYIVQIFDSLQLITYIFNDNSLFASLNENIISK